MILDSYNATLVRCQYIFVIVFFNNLKKKTAPISDRGKFELQKQ